MPPLRAELSRRKARYAFLGAFVALLFLPIESPFAEPLDDCAAPCLVLVQNTPSKPPPGGGAAPQGIDPKTIEKYGMALALGDRARQFAAEISTIRDAVQRGDAAAARAGIQALYAKAGRPVPEGRSLDQLVNQLPAPEPAGAGAPTGLGPTTPLGGTTMGTPAQGDSTKQPLGPTTPLGGSGTGAGKPSPPTVATGTDNAACGPGQAGKTQALAADKLVGEWADATGERLIRIRQRYVPGDNVNFTLGDQYRWQGELKGQKLTFTRKPIFSEINPLVPEWARKQVAGQLEWSIELDVKADCAEATLEGKWYSGEVKVREEQASSGRTSNQSASVLGKGPGIELKFKRPGPAIAHVYVLQNQLAMSDGGIPAWPYPFKKGASGVPADSARILFIYGRGLPRSWSDIKLTSADPAVRYVATVLPPDPDPHSEKKPNPREQELFDLGWKLATLNLDAPTKEFIKGMDAMILQVNLQPGVLPGLKEFKLNGLNGNWVLAFGDAIAGISFMRRIRQDIADPTTDLLLPEQVFLQVQTGGPLPLESIELRVHVNSALVKWNGAETLKARQISDTVYRTDRIELFESGKPAPPKEPGLFGLPVSAKSKIYVELADPYLLAMAPTVLKARVLETPADLGQTWTDALTLAARDVGITSFTTWEKLSATKATEIKNFNWTSLALKAADRASPIRFLLTTPSTNLFLPKVWQTNRPRDFVLEPIVKGKVIEAMEVKVGDLAALYLFADEFVRSTRARIETLQQIQIDKLPGDMSHRKLRETLRPNALDRDSEWHHIRVTCPSGGAADGCPYPYALFETYLKKTFGNNTEAADTWSLQATREAVAKLIEAGEASVKKVEGLIHPRAPGLADKATSVLTTAGRKIPAEPLLEIFGFSYPPLLPAVNARMMRREAVGTPPRTLWVPDLNARYELRNLHVLYDAVVAQKNYADLDRFFFLNALAAVAAPVLSGESVLMEAIGYLAEVSQFVIPLTIDIKDAVRQREDIKVALGASLVLGTQLLDQKELAKSEWFQIGLSNIPGAFQATLRTYRVVGIVRTHLAMAAVEKGGLKALEAMSAANQDAFWRFVTEAKLLKETRVGKALSAMHERADVTADKVIREMRLRESVTIRPAAVIEAVGQPGPIVVKEREVRRPQVSAAEQVTRTRRRNPAEAPAQPASAKPSEPAAKPGEPAAKPGGSPSGLPKTKKIEVEAAFDHPLLEQKPQQFQPFYGMYQGRRQGFVLGKLVGEGAYAKVFELRSHPNIPGCEAGCVIKIFKPDQGDLFFQLGADTVRGMEFANGLVAHDPRFPDIPQLRNISFHPDSPIPFLIQAAATSRQTIFSGKAAYLKALAAHPKLGAATMEFVRRLKLRGIHLQDLKVSNLFYEQVAPNQWVTGLVDFDRMLPWAARETAPNNLGAWLGYMEAKGWLEDYLDPDSGKVLAKANTSLKDVTARKVPNESDRAMLKWFQENPGPYYRDIDLTWEKTLEEHEWLIYDPSTKTYIDGMLKVDDVKPVLPRINDPERFNPFDASRPFAKPDRVGWLRLVPTEPARQLARGIPPTEPMRLAA